MLLLTLLAVWALAPRKRPAQGSYVVTFPLAGAWLLMLLVWSRGGTMRDLYTAVLVTVVAVACVRRRGPMAACTSAIDGIAIYLFLSVAAYYLLGMRSPAEAIRIGGLTNSTGLFASRIAFPFENSFVTAPILAAAYLAALPGLGLKDRKMLRMTGAIVAVFVLLAAGYRMPLVIAIGFVVVAIVQGRLVRRIAVPLVIVGLAFPLLYSAQRAVIQSTIQRVESSTSWLQREGSLAGRDKVWTESLASFGDGSTKTQLIGYGVNGHVKSGAAGRYGGLFRGFFAARSHTVASPHSSLLAELLDGGLIGAIDLVLLVAMLTHMVARRRRWMVGSGAVLGALVVLALTAGTETTIIPQATNTSEPFWLLLLFAACNPMAWKPRTGEATEGTRESVNRDGVTRIESRAALV